VDIWDNSIAGGRTVDTWDNNIAGGRTVDTWDNNIAGSRSVDTWDNSIAGGRSVDIWDNSIAGGRTVDTWDNNIAGGRSVDIWDNSIAGGRMWIRQFVTIRAVASQQKSHSSEENIITVNPLEAGGHYTYHQFNLRQSYLLPTRCIYVFCVDLRTNSDYFPIQP
jgi:hypothetical protein